MDSEILDQLTNLGKDVNSEFPKPKRGRNNRRLKKADPKMNELDSKFKKPEQNLIDIPPPPVVKTNTEPKRDIFEMY